MAHILTNCYISSKLQRNGIFKSGNRGSIKKRKPCLQFVNRVSLADQGSNLDSSEPKSDVLPVTPSANFSPFGL